MVASPGHRADLRTIALGSALLSGLVVAHLVRLVQERAHVEHAAQHDDLTGLPRGELFHARLAVSLAHAQQRQGHLCVMFIDLDRFKKINDSLGHAAGNQLLQLVAKRLRRCIREDDTVARNGGDEFTVLLPHLTDPADAEVVAEKILQAFVEPFALGKKKVFSSPSVGVALYPRDGNDPETLLKNADAAMYRAKEKGRNNYKLYTPDLNATAHEALDLESDLHLAMERNELVLNYQPRVDLKTGRIVGVEALVRWHHPTLGLLGPDRFIPVAEETGLIVPLGEWVMETACAQAVQWWETGYPAMQVAVNLSARQFQHGPVSDMVASVLRRTGLKPELLELEITESLALQGGDRAVAMLHDLRSIGVQCSIDDFGVGYSNFSYLGTLPIDTIKIDKSFMDNLRGGVGGTAVVIGLIALAHSLEMKVVAEGVETIDQLNFLKTNACDQMQGFLFSQPISPEQMESLLMLELVAPGPGRLGDESEDGYEAYTPSGSSGPVLTPAYDADHGRGVRRAGDRGEVAEPVG
jgi:diguanylate cyclase (GGDEF)-like protein